jgi:hypothetical protein
MQNADGNTVLLHDAPGDFVVLEIIPGKASGFAFRHDGRGRPGRDDPAFSIPNGGSKDHEDPNRSTKMRRTRAMITLFF